MKDKDKNDSSAAAASGASSDGMGVGDEVGFATGFSFVVKLRNSLY